jgi:hypothetical protein
MNSLPVRLWVRHWQNSVKSRKKICWCFYFCFCFFFCNYFMRVSFPTYGSFFACSQVDQLVINDDALLSWKRATIFVKHCKAMWTIFAFKLTNNEAMCNEQSAFLKSKTNFFAWDGNRMPSPCFRTKNIIVYTYFLCEKKGFGLHVIYITCRQTFKFKILGS